MRSVKRALLLVACLGLLVPVVPASANHTAAQCALFGGFTVDRSIAASNPAMNLFKTIQEAVGHLPNPGPCTVNIKAGIYTESVQVDNKNTLATGEANRIVIQRHPSATLASVVVDAPAASASNGHAFRLSNTRFLTIRNVTLSGSGREAILLRGDINPRNMDINIEGNDIHDNGNGAVSGGISVGSNTPRTWIFNNLIRANDGNGITVDSPNTVATYVVNNTIFGNQRNGIARNASANLVLVNNLIVGNGLEGGTTGGRFGLIQVGNGTAPTVTLTNNMFYRNTQADISTPLQTLDTTDSGNRTTFGTEGTVLTGIDGCTFFAPNYSAPCTNTHAYTEIFVSLSDFHLKTTTSPQPRSPAIDRGRNNCSPLPCGPQERVPTTDFEGDARPQDGDANVVATTDIGYDEAVAAIGPPATVVLDPAADTNPVGTSHTVTATVRDAATTPTPGIIVRFSVTGANSASGTDTTDANGEATFSYTGTLAGTDAITAFADTNGDGDQDVGEPAGAASKIWTAGAPATLVLDPPTATNTAGDEHCVTATVEDAFGNPVSGVTVEFSVTGANTDGGSATTDANGQATFCYTGTVAGADAITAFADTNGDGDQDLGEPAGAASKVWTAGAPATLVLDPPTATNTAGEEHCVTATVTDAFGNPVSGVTVQFSVTGANTASGSGTTDANGQATFCYTGTVAGVDAISAFADTNGNGDLDTGEPVGLAEKTYTPGAPAFVVLDPAADENQAGDEHCVTATVTDAFGNPVEGVTVEFSVTGANTAAGSDVTDAAGEATFCYTGTAVGGDAITAFADTNGDGDQDLGEPAGAATKTWTPGDPAFVVLDPAADENQAGEEHCVTATVTDAFGNPTPGITVEFSVSGANTVADSDVTDANGEATFCYTGTVAGLDTITAFADTNGDGDQDAGEPSGTATKLYTPGAPAFLTLSPATATNTVGEEHCVTATVTDAFGNPVPGVTVEFSVPTAVATFATPSSGDDTTNANGEATFCYTAALPGEDVIRAFADTSGDGNQDPGEPEGTATKTWTPPASTAFCEVKITEGGWIIAINGDQANFGGNAKVDQDGNVQGEQNYQDHGPADPRHVKSIELLATTCEPEDEPTEASIYGTATIDGAGMFFFKIDVTDAGEPGSDDTYGIIISDGYVSGQKVLQGGNVQIHKN